MNAKKVHAQTDSLCYAVDKSEERAEFLEVIKYDAVHSEGDEPGCMHIDVLRDNDDP